MIVPIIASATAKNATIPMYSDLPGIIGFTTELSDDGRMALVELVVKDRAQLNSIVASGQRLARKDSADKESIYQEFKQLKRTFKSERFGVAIP